MLNFNDAIIKKHEAVLRKSVSVKNDFRIYFIFLFKYIKLIKSNKI